ncbi:MAG: MOSC domain-containing protein [Waterburya sp.]
MIISELCVYPLKSCQGIELQQAQVTNQGFFWDRQMMLVSGSGKFITQRQFPQLAKVKVEIIESNISLRIEDATLPPLTFSPTLTGNLIEVEIWRDRLPAIDQGDAVAQWFQQLLNLEPNKVCRLVRQSPEHLRLLESKYASNQENSLSFADNYPIMLTATASLTELNQRIVEIHQQAKQAIPMNRFRPNIVVETIKPFVEDTWSVIQIGEIRFTVVKPCSRCIITTIDQQQGAKNQLKEPLNTLGTFRQLSEQGVMFGVNMIPQNQGTIQVGDRLEVLQTRD